MERVYISGSISSDMANAPRKFSEAEERVARRFGCQTINPLKLPHDGGAEWEDFMAVDLLELMTCDAIYMLPCWKTSPGAKLEHAIAKQIQIKIIYEGQ